MPNPQPTLSDLQLDITSIGEWMSSKPALLRAFLASGQPMDSSLCLELTKKISGHAEGQNNITDLIHMLCGDESGVRGLGRPGRFRIMVWLADNERNIVGRDLMLPVLVGDIAKDEMVVPPSISKLFHDDLLRFASEVIAPQSELTLNDPTLSQAIEMGLANFTQEVEIEPSSPVPG